MYNVYTDSVQSYTLGEFTKVFKGNLTNTQLVDKVSLLADDFLTVQDGTYKVQGQTYKLAKSRSTAFFADGYRGYFAELAKQLENER